MTRIVVVSERYHPFGGAELATHLILKLLKSENCDIRVLTGQKNIDKIHGVKYLYVPYLAAHTKVQRWINEVKLRSETWFKDLIAQNDIVYIPRTAYPIIPLAKKSGKKVIVHLHDYHPISYSSVMFHDEKYDPYIFHEMKKTLKFEIMKNKNNRKNLFSFSFAFLINLCKFWISKADEILCVSNRQLAIIQQAYLSDIEKKLRVIYNPLPKVPKIEKKLEDHILMYLGGDHYVKGFHTVLNASMRLLYGDHMFRILLLGSYENTSILLIDRLNDIVGGAYKMMGHIGYQEVLNYHSISHALIFTSLLEEPLPYVILESMLSGTIPIASRVGGVPEIVKGTFAEKMLFKPGDVDELVDRIQILLSLSNEQIIDLGLSLRETILHRFHLDAIKKKLINTFLV